jgi:hypothetical protein
MHTQIYVDKSDLFPYQPISPIWMVIYILSSFCFFTLLNRTINVHKNDIKSNWLKQNTLLSFIHSLICSVLSLIGVLRAPEMFEDPLSHSNHFNYALIAFSIGYFLYDFFDCLPNSTSSTFVILVHHIIVITFLAHVLFHTRNIGYAMYGLSLEINSIFLHARRLLRWYSPISQSVYYKNLLKISIDIGNYITFILFRIGAILISLRALYIQGQRLHPYIYIYTVTIVMSMGLLNLVLFYRLIRTQVKGKSKIKQQKEIEHNILVTHNHILLPN